VAETGPARIPKLPSLVHVLERAESREQRAEKFTRPSNITKRLVSYKKLFGSIYLEGKMLML
jgi:hypothetical protein